MVIILGIGAKTFEEENFREFRGFVAIGKVFSTKFAGEASVGSTSEQSTKVFSLESFPLYGNSESKLVPVLLYTFMYYQHWVPNLLCV